MSEFIKYQGNIAGTGNVSHTGALPLITTDKEPGARGGGGREGGERTGAAARDSGSDYSMGSTHRAKVLKVEQTRPLS